MDLGVGSCGLGFQTVVRLNEMNRCLLKNLDQCCFLARIIELGPNSGQIESHSRDLLFGFEELVGYQRCVFLEISTIHFTLRHFVLL